MTPGLRESQAIGQDVQDLLTATGEALSKRDDTLASVRSAISLRERELEDLRGVERELMAAHGAGCRQAAAQEKGIVWSDVAAHLGDPQLPQLGLNPTPLLSQVAHDLEGLTRRLAALEEAIFGAAQRQGL